MKPGLAWKTTKVDPSDPLLIVMIDTSKYVVSIGSSESSKNDTRVEVAEANDFIAMATEPDDSSLPDVKIVAGAPGSMRTEAPRVLSAEEELARIVVEEGGKPFGDQGKAIDQEDRGWRREVPPNVPGPTIASSHRWITDPSEIERLNQSVGLAGATHAGPRSIAQEKDNEDRVFSGMLATPQGDWVVIAVADGVSQAMWPERAALSSGYAFIETLSGAIQDGLIPQTSERLNPPSKRGEWYPAFAERLCQCIQTRLKRDLDVLRGDGKPFLPCSYDANGGTIERFKPKLYDKLFFSGKNHEAEIKNRWFQCTLLAAAIGPCGGFAVLLGDGYARTDRCFERRAGERQTERKPFNLVDDDAALEKLVSFWLTPKDIVRSMRNIPRSDATEVGILLATDGVAKCSGAAIAKALEQARLSGTSLADAEFQSSDDCAGFLDKLTRIEDLPVELDNMSIAYARRPLGRGDDATGV